VFDACLAALQMEGFPIHPAGVNREAGLIVTGKHLRSLTTKVREKRGLTAAAASFTVHPLQGGTSRASRFAVR